jgi:hypothetical protein
MRYILAVAAVAAVVAGTAVSQSAHAQGVAWLSTVEGSQFYPESWPAGQTGFTHTDTGAYQVTFYGLGNSFDSDVQVNSVDLSGQPHYCTSAGWYSSNGTDVTADVDCFNPQGQPADGDFNIFYQTRTGASASGTVAFLWANQPTTQTYNPDASYSYNSTGGTNSVTRENTGLYYTFLPGFTKSGGNPEVTAYGGNATHCEVVDWYHNRAGTNVVVYCFNAAGAPTDSYFDLSFTQNTTEAVGTSTSLGAYVWANEPTASGEYTPAKVYQFNNVSTKKLDVQNIGGGTSFLNMSVPENVLFSSTLGMITAYGSAGEFCEDQGLGYYGSAKHETLTLTVQCYTNNGSPVNASYDATLLTGQ